MLKGRPPKSASYQTKLGCMFNGSSEEILTSPSLEQFKGEVQLIFTSPPFPLNRKKKYGNLQGQKYVEWLRQYGPIFKNLLKKDGSIVLEIGNSWEPGTPVMSTLGLKALLDFQEANELYLCQEFICHNPARLPSPAQWVNVERIRVKDNYTRLWWLSKTAKPKANNRNILEAYSESMKKLLKSKKYNGGARPSEHHIGKTSFLTNNAGAIPGNVLSLSNTASSDDYLTYCRENDLAFHPARMQSKLAEFFIKFLTDESDLVLDPFGGSNTTGAVAEALGRRWISVEADENYIEGSRGRFVDSLI